jgi:hypothetical protein
MREFEGVDAARVAGEVLPAKTPAVLKGLLRHWPAVTASARSAASLCSYLRRFESGVPVLAVMTPPEEQGRICYKRRL